MLSLSSRTKTLLNALIHQNKLPNGLILYSPNETFRNETATYLAQSCFCPEFHEKNVPCLTCKNCTLITDNNFVDLQKIQTTENEKTHKIDTLRDIQENCKYGPHSHEHLLIIIENAHTLTQEAANAFLKTLEEPPPHTHFILCCPSPKTLLSTIQSRCHSLDLPQNTPNSPPENWPHYTQVCQWSLSERIQKADLLSEDKLTLVEGLSNWLQTAVEHQNIPHILHITETLRRLKFNINKKLQLEALLLQL